MSNADAACCFDMYGTLCDTTSVTHALRKELDVADGLAEAIDEVWRRKQLQYASQLSQMDDAYEPFWEVTRKGLAYALAYYDVSADEATRERLLASYDRLDPFPDAIDALRELRSAGITVAVLSNGDPAMLEHLAANAGLEPHLDAVLSADAVGTFKPSPAVYENAADRLDRPIDACRLVSSNAWDVAGAGHAGMGTAWVNRSNEPPESIGAEADLEVGSLSDLPDAIG